MDELARGLYDYAAFHDGIGMTVHSHFAAQPGVLVDPMPLEGALPAPARLAVLTNRHHLRHAAAFGCPVVCHEAGLREFEGADVDVRGFQFGDELAPGVRALEVAVLCPEETALHLDIGEGFLALADAVIRDGDGELAFVPDWLLGDDPQAVKTGLRGALRRLLDAEPFDGLLLAHGAPTAQGGRDELERFVRR